MNLIKFNKMTCEDFFARPQLGETGYTFRNEGGEGDLVFTLLEDYDTDNPRNCVINVLCHSLSRNSSWTEKWDDLEYLASSFKNGEYFPYWKDAEWLYEYYIN